MIITKVNIDNFRKRSTYTCISVRTDVRRSPVQAHTRLTDWLTSVVNARQTTTQTWTQLAWPPGKKTFFEAQKNIYKKNLATKLGDEGGGRLRPQKNFFAASLRILYPYLSPKTLKELLIESVSLTMGKLSNI